MGWFLFLLAVAGGVAFAIWNFHRKTAARKAASEARFEKIIKGSAQIPASAQQLRRLAQYPLDFVICDKSMQVVAVVEVESAAGADAAGDQRFKSDLLKQAGIRLVRISPTALPQRERIRTLIDGGSPQ